MALSFDLFSKWLDCAATFELAKLAAVFTSGHHPRMLAVGTVTLHKSMKVIKTTSILADPGLVGNGPATTCANIMFSAKGGPASGGHRVFIHNEYYNTNNGQQTTTQEYSRKMAQEMPV